MKRSPKLYIVKKSNYYLTSVPEYDTKAGDEEDWMRLNLMLNDIRWESLMENLSAEESLNIILKVIEEKVAMVFNKKSDFLEEKSSNQPSGRFQNGNKIPREIRNHMRKKRNLSKMMLRSTSWTKLLKLRENLESIETKLQSSYETRRNDQEIKAIKKIKKDPKSFYGKVLQN